MGIPVSNHKITSEKVAKDIGAYDVIDDLLPNVMELFPKAPSILDVQETCLNYPLEQLRADVDDAVRYKIDQRIFNEGGESKNTFMVFGILLRDAAFKKLGIGQ